MFDNRSNNTINIKKVFIPVSDLHKSVFFYCSLSDFTILEQTSEFVSLSANRHSELIRLIKHDGFSHVSFNHFAIVLPSRKNLGCFLHNLISRQIAILGAIDHSFSESIYLEDPDKNKIEIAWDKEDEEWFDEFNELKTSDQPFDYSGVYYECEASVDKYAFPEDTKIGHVILKVQNIEKQRYFYESVLGFPKTQDKKGEPLLLGHGNYHHHIGLTPITESADSNPQTPCVLSIAYPDCDTLKSVMNKIIANHLFLQETDSGYVTEDYEANKIYLSLDA